MNFHSADQNFLRCPSEQNKHLVVPLPRGNLKSGGIKLAVDRLTVVQHTLISICRNSCCTDSFIFLSVQYTGIYKATNILQSNEKLKLGSSTSQDDLMKISKLILEIASDANVKLTDSVFDISTENRVLIFNFPKIFETEKGIKSFTMEEVSGYYLRNDFKTENHISKHRLIAARYLRGRTTLVRRRGSVIECTKILVNHNRNTLGQSHLMNSSMRPFLVPMGYERNKVQFLPTTSWKSTERIKTIFYFLTTHL